MDWLELRYFLDLLMCSDPWPITDEGESQKSLKNFADKEAQKFGFSDWVEAYHKL